LNRAADVVGNNERRLEGKAMMAEIDLTFLQRQQEQILDEMRQMRIEHRDAIQGVRDDMDVLKASIGALSARMQELTTMGQRLENASGNQQDVNTLILDRLSKLTERSAP
jgi:prefoldin subunit 5